jgi:hypothetical protein
MKKLIYSAVMALVLSCFIGCMPRVSVGNEPQLDETNSKLDGKYYDNTEYKCWKFTWEYTEKSTGEADVHESGVDYDWLTELWAQYEKAMWLYSHNVSASGYGARASVTGTCTLEQTPDDESTCYDRDED